MKKTAFFISVLPLIFFASAKQTGGFSPQTTGGVDEKFAELQAKLIKRGISRDDTLMLAFEKSLGQIRQDNGDEKAAVFLSQVENYAAKYSIDRIRRLLNDIYGIMFEGRMTPDGAVLQWRAENAAVKWLDGDFPRFGIEGAEIICSYNDLELKINDAKGVFSAGMDAFEGSEGQVVWRRDSLQQTTAATAKIYDYSINTRSNGYTAKKALLDFAPYGSEIGGTLTDQVQKKDAQKSVFPVFGSSEANFSFTDDKQAYNLTGGIELQGMQIYCTGDTSFTASLELYRNGERQMRINSRRFLLRQNSIIANSAQVTVFVINDSIIHPNQQIVFDRQKQLLMAGLNQDRLSRAPYINTFNAVQMFPSSLVWDLDSTTVYFTADKLQTTALYSNRYYEKAIFESFQGLSSSNPIVKLAEMQKRLGTEQISYMDVSNALGISKDNAIHLMMDLAFLGYADYNTSRRSIVLYPSIVHLLQSARRLSDYDAISFHSLSEAETKYKLNLETGLMSITGLDFIKITEGGEITIFPDLSGVRLKDNLDFQLDGRSQVGLFSFEGDDYSFSYDKYTMEMTGTQKMRFEVPSFEPDADGSYSRMFVKNVIDSLRGTLYLNLPNNKSQRNPKPEYPKLDSKNETYVFYTGEAIGKQIYNRDELFVQLKPFTLDSMLIKNPRDILLPGIINTNGIIPNFEETLTVQRDYTLGFEMRDFHDGVDFYKKGKFYNIISLNQEGLLGNGRFEYKSATVHSAKMNLYPDRLLATADSLNIKKFVSSAYDVPSVSGVGAKVEWLPEADSLIMRTGSKTFGVFDRQAAHTGSLVLSGKGLKGSGKVDFDLATASSKDFDFKSTSLGADNMDIAFGLVDNRNKIKLANVQGLIDLSRQSASFKQNDATAYVSLDVNKYRVYLPNVVWDMQGKSLVFSSDKGEPAYLASQALTQDSLRFKAERASYSLVSDEIQATGVSELNVGDALIVPEGRQVKVFAGGSLAPFENAELYIDRFNKTHYLSEAKIKVVSGKSYNGSATYRYKNSDGTVKPIIFDNIQTDQNGVTKAEANIPSGKVFNISPYFDFYGKINLQGSLPDLIFQGQLMAKKTNCPNIDIGTMYINTAVNPKTAAFTPGAKADGTRANVFNGVYANSLGQLAVGLMKEDTLMHRSRIASVDGILSYDEKNKAYRVRKDTTVALGNEFNYYPEECRVSVRSPLNFADASGTIEWKGFGRTEYGLAERKIQIKDAALALKFPALLQELMYTIAMVEKENNIGGINTFSPSLRFAASNLHSETKADSEYGYTQTLPKELEYSLLLSELNFTWDERKRVFVSDGDKFGLAISGNTYVGQLVKGKIEINRSSRIGGEELTIYFEDVNGLNYFFKYRQGLLEFSTNNSQAMAAFDKIDTKRLDVKYPGGATLEIRKTTPTRVQFFVNAHKGEDWQPANPTN